MLNIEHTTESYSGRPGCMCGCNGTYNESERARRMAITAMLKNENARLNDFGRVDSEGVSEKDIQRMVRYHNFFLEIQRR